MVEFICHTENRKSAILISDTTLSKEEIDEIKEKLWHMSTLKKSKFRNNQEIELKLNSYNRMS